METNKKILGKINTQRCSVTLTVVLKFTYRLIYRNLKNGLSQFKDAFTQIYTAVYLGLNTNNTQLYILVGYLLIN